MDEIADCWVKICWERVSTLRSWATVVEFFQKGINGAAILGAVLLMTGLSLACVQIIVVASLIVAFTGVATGITAVAISAGYQKYTIITLNKFIQKHKSESYQIKDIFDTLNNIFKTTDLKFYIANNKNANTLETGASKLNKLKTYAAELLKLQSEIKYISTNNTVITPTKDGGEEINTTKLKAFKTSLKEYSVLYNEIRKCIQDPIKRGHVHIKEYLSWECGTKEDNAGMNPREGFAYKDTCAVNWTGRYDYGRTKTYSVTLFKDIGPRVQSAFRAGAEVNTFALLLF